jgi:hypothetical protein
MLDVGLLGTRGVVGEDDSVLLIAEDCANKGEPGGRRAVKGQRGPVLASF